MIRETFGPHITPHPGWRRCARCGGLVFTEDSAPGACSAGGQHDVNAGASYWLLRGRGVAGEHHWRRCARCEVLFYEGVPGPRPCPAGGSHEPFDEEYTLSLGPVPHPEAGWRRCNRCQAATLAGTPGACSAGGVHDTTGSAGYTLSLGLVGEIPNGARVTLRGCNDQYVVAENGGGGAVNVNRDLALEWETFTVTVT